MQNEAKFEKGATQEIIICVYCIQYKDNLCGTVIGIYIVPKGIYHLYSEAFLLYGVYSRQ